MGYWLSIKNSLLEPKHVERMDSSVWLFMWFLDKVMAINENGIGKVYNGKPVIYEEVKGDLGISHRTYDRWVKRLEDAKYIRTIRAPYGLVVYVNKAAKMWGQRTPSNNNTLFNTDAYVKNGASDLKKGTEKASRYAKSGASRYTKMAHHYDKNGVSNKDNSSNDNSRSAAAAQLTPKKVFKDIANVFGTTAKPEDNRYIVQVITKLLKHHDPDELLIAVREVIADPWVQTNRRTPSEKLNYLFFTRTQNKNADIKLAASIERVARYITQAQERQDTRADTDSDSRPIRRIVFGGNNE